MYSDSDSDSEDDSNSKDDSDSKDDNDREGEEITENQEKIIKRFFKPLPLLEDIKIQPSLSIFHKLNCLYFFFNEHKKKDFVPKPILKIHNEDSEKKKSNKKVTIKLHDIDNNNNTIGKHRFTRKHR